MKLNCYIVDDEPLAIEVLKSHIENFGNLEIKGTFQNPIKAFQALHDDKVDLLFLDVQMPKLTGIDFLKSMKNPPIVIFTTAYREYALAGFELDIVDYLLKPISFERFLKAMGKVFNHKSGFPQLKETEAGNPFLYVPVEKKINKILLDEILYFESQRDYVKIITESKTFKVHEQISSFEERLRLRGFLRIHRSFIVPVNKIESWSAYKIEIKKYTLPIGRTFSKEVLRILKARINNL